MTSAIREWRVQDANITTKDDPEPRGIANWGNQQNVPPGRAFLGSIPRTSTYEGLTERAAAGLDAFALGLFKKHVPPSSKVLDLSSGEAAWAMRLHNGLYKVTACDVEPPPDRALPFAYIKEDLNANFSDGFAGGEYDAISFIEVSSTLRIRDTHSGRLRPCSRMGVWF